jgi:hypothetical protein
MSGNFSHVLALEAKKHFQQTLTLLLAVTRNEARGAAPELGEPLATD